jgi:glycolate oxidase
VSGPRAGLDRAASRALAGALDGALSTRLEDRICYSFDATDLRSLPDAVGWPSTTGHVAEVARVALGAGLAVVPRGAGTGYTGGSVPIGGGVVLSFEKMDHIIAVDAGRRIAVVEPGVVNASLRERVEALGLFYPPDPASLKVSTIGGNVAEGAGGPRTVLYGTTRDYVVGIEAVMPDGTVVGTGVLSDAPEAGWDAGMLLVGSEGTLAIVTKVALRLSELPESFATLWAEFPSLYDAARTVAALTAEGLPLSVLEVLDRETYSCAHEYVRGARPDGAAEGALLVELEGDRSAVATGAERARHLLSAGGAIGIAEAATDREREEIWEIRRAISPALARIGAGKLNEDIAVPRSAIPRFVEAMSEISASAELPILAFGHAGDGNLHVNVMVDRADPSAMNRARQAVARLFSAALGMGGTLSGEHGIGITKAEHLAEELDATALAVTAAVKRALDPAGILNPDKILTDRPNPWWETAGPSMPGGGSGRC